VSEPSKEFGTWAPGEPAPTTDLQTVLAALYEPEQLVTLAEALGGGSFPGIGTIENDTMDLVDSVGPGFPLNIPFVLPSNMVKHQKAWLSFKLLAYRTYSIAGASNTFVTSPLTSAGTAIMQTSGFFTGPFSVPLNTSIGGHQHPQAGALDATGTNNVTAGNIITDAIIQGGVMAYSNPSFANIPALNQPSASALTSITPGIVESSSATGVTVLIDGTDYTTQLGGPFNADTFELDITNLGWAKTPGIHTCQLTSTQLGRIVGWVRNNYIVNPFK